MENQEKKFTFTFNKSIILNAILIIALILLGWQNFKQDEMIDKQTVQLSSKNTDDNKHTSVVYEQKLETLKKTNRELYDSLKVYKDEIDYLVQFKHKKEYVVHDTITKIDTAYIEKENEVKINEYTYSNKEKNDTLTYELKIGSTVEPNWYSIRFRTSEQFTLVNKNINGINETTIAPSSGNGQITDVTVLKQKEKFKWKDRIVIGPSVSTGFTLINKQLDIMIGLSVVVKLW